MQIYLFFFNKIDNYLKMFLNHNTQLKNEHSDPRSAFRPTGLSAGFTQLQEKLNSFSSAQIYGNFSKQLFAQTAEKQPARDAEVWTRAQIERLFKLYDYYGPQWKIMSQQMPTRTANNLKNRFYTVLRNLIKLLFRKKSDTCPKLPGEIPSKDLSRLYDGKQDYKEFKGLISAILQEISYNLDSEKIESVVRNYSNQIIKVYQVIYGDRALPPQPALAGQQIGELKQEENPPSVLASIIPPNKLEQSKIGNMDGPREKNQNGDQKIQQKQEPGFFYLFFFNPSEFYPQQGF